MGEKSESLNPRKALISGAVGGMCTVLVGHPLDTIKVKLQTMPPTAPGEKPLYTGMIDCGNKIIKAYGLAGLYKGMQAPLLNAAPIFAICFAGFTLGKQIQQTGDNAELKLYQKGIAGGFSGIFTACMVSPVERIKCLLQIQGETKKYNGMVDCTMKLFKEGGLRSVFKGLCATLVRGEYK